MTSWTHAAREELDRYFAGIRPGLTASGADADEVTNDLRAHLEAEATAANLTVVTAEDVQRLLRRIGAPPTSDPGSDAGTAGRAAAREAGLSGPVADVLPPVERRHVPPSRWLLAFGVVLPALTWLIELVTEMCAATFFDPMPTVWHMVLVACVPAVNALSWQAARQGRAAWRTRLGWLNAVAMGLSLFYALLYIPLVPPGLVAVIFFGWGLLPLSPLLALLTTMRLRVHLRRLPAAAPDAPLPGLAWGTVLGLVCLLLLEAPVMITRVGLQLAHSETEATRVRGVQMLRRFGHEQTLLRACYGRTPMAAEFGDLATVLLDGRPVWPEAAREIYFRVRGRAFNTVPPPRMATPRGGRWMGLDEFTWDRDQGGTQVAGRVKGLSLRGSRLDAAVESDAAHAYVEWTLEFQNVAPMAREARAQILLPPGGVVSRLTLWVNGEPREAAFAGTAQTREAYREVVVVQRRDPVLVTWAGPDRVMMQCFPVPANGGVMKVRLGISAPLTLASATEGALVAPCFLERNFTVPDAVQHALWFEGQGVVVPASGPLKAERSASTNLALRGSVTDAALGGPQTVLRVQRGAGAASVWARDTRAVPPQIVRQTFTPQPTPALSRLAFVVDGSVGMEAHYAAVAAALRGIGPGIEGRAWLASDTTHDLTAGERGGAAVSLEVAAGRLERATATGGQDNAPALLQAIEWVTERPGGAVIWVHGPQPVPFSDLEPLVQRFAWRAKGPRVYDLQTAPGPNRLVERLAEAQALRRVARLGEVSADLSGLIETLRGGRTAWRAERSALSAEGFAPAAGARETNLNLARLWAFDEVQRREQQRAPAEALELAARYQLVTAVSGAVVLETAAQYERAGLQPVEPATVPMIPEPQTWALLAAGLALLAGRFGFRRAPAASGSGANRTRARGPRRGCRPPAGR